jgi:uroporphyrinogen decarboxylase
MIRAFCLEEPDKVPVFEQEIQPPTSDVALGRECTIGNKRLHLEILEKGKVSRSLLDRMIEDHVDVASKLGLDGVVLGPNIAGEFTPYRRISEHEWQGEGRSIHYFPSSDELMITDLEIRKKGIEGLKYRIEELREHLDMEPDNLYVFERVKKELERRNLDLFIFVGCVLFGWHGSGWMDLALKWFYTEPDMMREYLEAYNRRAIETVKMMIELGVDAVLDGGDLAYKHGPMFSPKMYREFILPYQKMHSETFHKRGLFVVNRSDGNIWPIADDFLINSRVDGYCEIDKNSGMDLGELKEVYGHMICLLGNVNCASTLVSGSIQDVAEETKDCIRKAAPGGGHVLCSSNVVHHGVKPENYFAMLKTGQKYGRYSMHRTSDLFII